MAVSDTSPPSPEPPPRAASGEGTDPAPRRLRSGMPLWGRLLLLVVVLLGGAALWAVNLFLTERFTETVRNRAELRLALYSGNVQAELQRSAVVPLLLARDPELVLALTEGSFATTSARLIQTQSEIGTAAIMLLDEEGRTVAATDRNLLGASLGTTPAFVEARRSSDTVFNLYERAAGGYAFSFSRTVRSGGRVLGVIVVEVDLAKFERSWAGFAEAVAITDSQGRIILSTEPRWRGRTIEEALAIRDAPSAIARALRVTADWAQDPPDAFLSGEAVLRSEARIPFHGWRIVSFTRYDSVREQVNAVLALMIMGFAVLLTFVFYLLSRRAVIQSRAFQRESAELRRLNARLQREVAEREKAQKNLAVAEQTLAQSSKLAVLGEMSASVSHELNQPLAAMKTYLAGARLLIQRRRPEEALSSFQRIDDLIERMGAITRQLKSYARKGGEAFAPTDLREAITGALSIMDPALRARRVRITRTVPQGPVRVMADPVRLEQVIINLLRNAVDATEREETPQIDILLSVGDTAVLSVRDNGHGIGELDKLFEPFYTTKPAGHGVGLGLAISSGIVSDFGGRLTARNAEGGGAVFEMQLPLIGRATGAATAGVQGPQDAAAGTG